MSFSVWPALIGAGIVILFMIVVPLVRMSSITRAVRQQNPAAINFPVLTLPAVREQLAELHRRLPWQGSLPSRVARPVAVLAATGLTLWNSGLDGQPVLHVARDRIVSVDLGTIAALRPIRTLQWGIATPDGVVKLDLPVFTATSLVSAVDVPQTEILLVDINDELWPEPPEA